MPPAQLRNLQMEVKSAHAGFDSSLTKTASRAILHKEPEAHRALEKLRSEVKKAREEFDNTIDTAVKDFGNNVSILRPR